MNELIKARIAAGCILAVFIISCLILHPAGRKRVSTFPGTDPQTIGLELVRLLRAGNETEREHAAILLGDLRVVDAIPVLIETLDDTSQKVVSAAALALGKIGDVAAVDPLRKANTKYKKRFTTGELGYNTSALPSIHRALNQLMTVRKLIHMLRTGETEEKLDAARRLGETRCKQAIQPLVQALGDQTPSVRGWAAWALAEIGDHAAIAPLINEMENGERASKFTRLPNGALEPKQLRSSDEVAFLGAFSLALQKLTGESFESFEEWKIWWQKEKAKGPNP